MNNKQAAVIVRPYLEALDLSAASMKTSYQRLRIGEFVTKLCLRSYLEYARLSADGDSDEVRVDMAPVVKDMLVLMLDDEKKGRSVLSVLKPMPKLIVSLAGVSIAPLTQEIIEVYLKHNAVVAGRDFDRSRETDLIKDASPEDLFRIAQLNAMRESNLFEVIASALQEIAFAFLATKFEETMVFADFSEAIGNLDKEARKSFDGSFMQKFSDKSIENAFDYKEIPFSDLAFSQFVNQFIGSNVGLFENSVGDRALVLLDYYLSLLTRK